VTINAGDGHAASKTLAPERFTGGEAPSPAGAEPEPTPGDVTLASPDTASDVASSDLARIVERAVSRQVEPVLVRIEEMDARLRFADMLSGLFFILGLAGMALWALGRRR
jgi:nickel transport protein